MPDVKEVKIALQAERFGTPRVSADLAFGGQGPDVRVSAKLDVVNAGRQLALEFTMDAKETKSDWAHLNGRATYVVYDVADKYPGHRILDIVTDAFSYSACTGLRS